MGIVLGIYAGTTIASYFLYGIASAALDKRLDREGYVDLKKQASAIEKLKEFLEIGIILSVPVLNIAISSYVFFSDKLYDEVLNTGLKEGYIRKKTPEELALEETKKEAKLYKKQKEETPSRTVTKTETHIKSYSEMTNEEKLAFLEREKAFLLSQNVKETSKSYNDRGAYRK